MTCLYPQVQSQRLANYGLWAESSPPHFVKTVLWEPSYAHFVCLVSGRFPATRAGLSSPNKDLTSYKAQQTSYQFLYRKFHQSLICPVLISISPIFQLINHILMNIEFLLIFPHCDNAAISTKDYTLRTLFISRCIKLVKGASNYSNH